ncbi:MAG: glycosyltransferase family 4 protein [Acidimicrobiia bacterium]|nr:glycosyltransferase family 4 protein [Acidimicrobiia bacterium]
MNQSATAIAGTVLLVTSSYPKHANEPSGIFLYHLSRQLAVVGWRVLVLAPNFPGGQSQQVLDGVEIRRFTYFLPRRQALCYRSGMLPNLKQSLSLWVQVPFYMASLFASIIRVVRKERVQVINAHWIVPQGVVTRLIQAFTLVPVVLTVHGGDIFAFQGRVGRFLKKAALKRADACTANSVFTRGQVLQLCPSANVTIVPMGVDVGEFEPRRADSSFRQNLGVSAEMILFVGRLVEKKGVHNLLAAMQHVLSRFPNATLVLVGDGAQRQDLERMASELEIGASVRFLGKLPHEQLPAYYAAADLFVGPSVVDRSGDTEGLGVVFIEAASAGLAMVGTSVGGISDVLIHEVTGIAVEPDEPEVLAGAIERLLRDEALRRRLGEAARQHVLRRFSWNQVAAQFSDVFRSVLERQRERLR